MISKIIFGVAGIALLAGIILIAASESGDDEFGYGILLLIVAVYLLPIGGLAVQISRVQATVDIIHSDLARLTSRPVLRSGGATERQQPTQPKRPIGTQPKKE